MNIPLIEPLEARIAPAGIFTVAKQADIDEGNSGEKNLVFVVTLTGTMTIATNTWREFIVTITTAVGAGAMTIQSIGTGTYS